MAQLPELPEWLTELLAEYDPQCPIPVEAPIAPGDIRMCEGTGQHYMVLVVEVHERHVNIALLTNEVEIAADCTPILTPAMTGLAYKLLALNLVGPVWPHQLGDRLAQVPNPAVIRRMVYGDVTAFHQNPHIARGLPFSGPGNYRWTAHEDALKDLQSLCYQAMGELLGEP
jgi:hypothetical protein